MVDALILSHEDCGCIDQTLAALKQAILKESGSAEAVFNPRSLSASNQESGK